MKAEDGKLYAVVTLRDVVERNDVGDLPFLSEIKRLYDENDRLRELVRDLYLCSDPCNDCPHFDGSGEGYFCDLGMGWKLRRIRELGIEVE